MPKYAGLKFMKKYFMEEVWNFIAAMVILLIGQVADFSVPLFIGLVMTRIENRDFEAVKTLCWQLFIIVIVSGFFVGIRAAAFNAMSQRIAVKLRHDFFGSVLSKTLSSSRTIGQATCCRDLTPILRLSRTV